MPEFIYQMHAVRMVRGDKLILDDVTLAFLPGAKIGVVGPNGAGKSSLLKMMAGLEQPSNGDARLFPGFTVGLLAQEPVLDESKTVLGNVEEGVADVKALLERYNETAELMATDYSDELLAEMGRLQRAVRWRAAPRGAVQAAAVAAGPAAARRANQPPGRRERAVVGTAPGEVPGDCGGGHPRPVLPGQRRAVDP